MFWTVPSSPAETWSGSDAPPRKPTAVQYREEFDVQHDFHIADGTGCRGESVSLLPQPMLHLSPSESVVVPTYHTCRIFSLLHCLTSLRNIPEKIQSPRKHCTSSKMGCSRCVRTWHC